jgi:OFA family oxalate/formate antiporter-like MFS transporter
VGILSLFNGAGRIIWGFVSDKVGRQRTMLVMFVLNAAIMFLLRDMGRTIFLLAIAAAVVGFCFGGTLAIFPSATADSFGTKYLGVNYGLMFTAYGVAGIIGPMIGALVHDVSGAYVYAFLVAAILSAMASLLSLTVTTKKK